MSDLVPRKTLVKQGGQAIGGVAAGIALIALSSLGGLPAVIVGGVIAVVGLAIARSPSDRVPGVIATAAGGLTILSGLIHFGHGILVASGIGLLIMGGINLYKFIKGYRKRM